MCKAMRWAHLPVAGGLYDQHPKLIDQWQYIMAAEAEEEVRKEAIRALKAGKVPKARNK